MTLPATCTAFVLDLFDRYYERVYLFARKSLCAPEAEDIAQEVFFGLMRLKNVEERELSVSYLLKIADNLIKRRHRHNERFKRYMSCADGGQRQGAEATDDAGPPERDALQDALARLDDNEYRAVMMIVCHGMRYEDAAQSLGVPVSTINNWKYRGLQKLQKGLQPARTEQA